VARERPTASPGSPLTGLDGDASAGDTPRVGRAEAHALRRSAPSTHAQLAEHLEPLRTSHHRQRRRVGEDEEPLAEDAIHTVFRSATGNWANQVASGDRVYGVYATKEECVRRAQSLATALGVEHVIHDVDGAVASRTTPRSDPGWL
jgi:hypothetical protein